MRKCIFGLACVLAVLLAAYLLLAAPESSDLLTGPGVAESERRDGSEKSADIGLTRCDGSVEQQAETGVRSDDDTDLKGESEHSAARIGNKPLETRSGCFNVNIRGVVNAPDGRRCEDYDLVVTMVYRDKYGKCIPSTLDPRPADSRRAPLDSYQPDVCEQGAQFAIESAANSEYNILLHSPEILRQQEPRRQSLSVYVTAQHAEYGESKPVILGPITQIGQLSSFMGVELNLQPFSVIKGKLVNQNREPIPDARIAITYRSNEQVSALAIKMRFLFVDTDMRGDFAIEKAVAGTYCYHSASDISAIKATASPVIIPEHQGSSSSAEYELNIVIQMDSTATVDCNSFPSRA